MRRINTPTIPYKNKSQKTLHYRSTTVQQEMYLIRYKAVKSGHRLCSVSKILMLTREIVWSIERSYDRMIVSLHTVSVWLAEWCAETTKEHNMISQVMHTVSCIFTLTSYRVSFRHSLMLSIRKNSNFSADFSSNPLSLIKVTFSTILMQM